MTGKLDIKVTIDEDIFPDLYRRLIEIANPRRGSACSSGLLTIPCATLAVPYPVQKRVNPLRDRRLNRNLKIQRERRSLLSMGPRVFRRQSTWARPAMTH